VTFFSGTSGTLSVLGGGSYAGGVYTVSGTAAEVTAALNGLLFSPTAHQIAGGGTITTNFTIHDVDSALRTANDTSTSVNAIATVAPPTINGGRAGQVTTDQSAITPFGSVVIADVNSGQTETVTVTLSAAANGTLSVLGGGSYDPVAGVYRVVGSANAVTTALNGLVFTPSPHQVVPGGTIATTFAVRVVDTAAQSAIDNTTTVVATAVATVPSINGINATQRTTDQAGITPFGGVAIGDVNLGQTETVTVTLSAAANGTLSVLGGGSYDAVAGVYTISGTASAITLALNGLTFTPTLGQVAPGGTVTTTLTIQDVDTAGAMAANKALSVIATAGTVAPSFSGVLAGWSISDLATLMPFAGVTLADANFGQTETVTVTLSAPANGTLSVLGGGRYISNTGVYTVGGTAGAVTAALNGLVFTPTVHQVAPGGNVATSFTIQDTDSAGATAPNRVATVIVAAVAVAPTITGTQAGETTTDNVAITPFGAVTVFDSNFGQIETVTVTLTAAANGTLGSPNGGTYNPFTGVYTYVGFAAAVTAALRGLVFTPTLHQIASGFSIATGFTIRDTDTAGAMATDTVTSVIVTAVLPPGVVNNPDGTSQLTVFSQGGVKTVTQYSGLNNTGVVTSQVIDNTDGTSYLRALNPVSTATAMTSEYSGIDCTGAKISDVVNKTDGSTLIYAYNPTAAASLTCQTWTGTNPADGSPAGTKISDVVNGTDGSAAIYEWTPSPTVTLNVTKFGSFNPATGAPNGPQISDILNNADGTSILYAYNPTSSVSQTASFYSATDPSNGAPAGFVTLEVFNFTAGGSSVTVGGVTQYYSGPDGTGWLMAGAAAAAPFGAFRTASAPTSDMAVITFSGSGQSIDPGDGDHTIQFVSGGTSDTAVLHLGGSDEILGFDPDAGDMLDLRALLSEANVSIAPDKSQLGQYLSLDSANGAVLVWFDGSQVASLADSGGLLAQLQTFRSFEV